MILFRFHAELDDFLPRQRRGQAFPYPGTAVTPVKHMIEALGVPHTEVGSVYINGVPVGPTGRPGEGDRVDVHPHRPGGETAGWWGGRSDPPGAIRFLADAHLGGLARLLRMAGFDTRYENPVEDAQLVRTALSEGRILLSRDRELLKRREVVRGCFLHALDPPAQLEELGRRLGLARAARPFSRCLACNVPLHSLAPERAWPRVPPAVRAGQSRFSECAVCRRIYWEGSHWRRMRRVLARALHLDEVDPG